MKKIYYLLISMFLTVTLSACSQEDELEAIADEHADEVLVKLNIGGEISTDYSPLTRAGSTDDLIGIQVDRINSSGNVEAHFAFGLFDRLDGISIYLKKEYTYKIIATMVKDGKNKLYPERYGNDDNYGYTYPFYIGTYFTTINSFNYISNRCFSYLTDSKVRLINDTYVSNYPQVDRLFAEISPITPSANAEINLNLKRVSFGMKYEVAGLDEGTLNVKIEKKNTNAYTFVNATGIENGYKSDATIYTFTDMMTAYNRDSYYETFTVSVSHKHSVINVTEDLESVDVKIYRNRMNNIKINLSTLVNTRASDVEGSQPHRLSVINECEDLTE